MTYTIYRPLSTPTHPHPPCPLLPSGNPTSSPTSPPHQHHSDTLLQIGLCQTTAAVPPPCTCPPPAHTHTENHIHPILLQPGRSLNHPLSVLCGLDLRVRGMAERGGGSGRGGWWWASSGRPYRSPITRFLPDTGPLVINLGPRRRCVPSTLGLFSDKGNVISGCLHTFLS